MDDPKCALSVPALSLEVSASPANASAGFSFLCVPCTSPARDGADLSQPHSEMGECPRMGSLLAWGVPWKIKMQHLEPRKR